MSQPEPKAVMVNVLKGGLGKSTVTKNTAACLGESDRVLVMDTDDNGHLTKHLGFKSEFYQADHFADVLNEYSDVEVTDLICETDFNFDFLPATHHSEQVEAAFKNQMNENIVLKQELVDPLLGDKYDYILFDTPANRSLMVRNAAVASGNLIMPLAPGEEGKDGMEATMNRIYRELNEKLPGGLKMLAIVPNQIQDRIDHNNDHRELIEEINTRVITLPHTGEKKKMADWVPNFAHIPEEVWDAIDARELNSNPKPGIRKDNGLNNPEPVTVADPENQNIEYFKELADIVRHGKVERSPNITENLLREHGAINDDENKATNGVEA